MRHPALTPQPQSITALWPVLVYHLAEGRRLSWPDSLGLSWPGRILVVRKEQSAVCLYPDNSVWIKLNDL